MFLLEFHKMMSADCRVHMFGGQETVDRSLQDEDIINPGHILENREFVVVSNMCVNPPQSS